MRNLKALARHRIDVSRVYGWNGDDENGAFRVRSETAPNQSMIVLASSGNGWDHISVSLRGRCPTWAEMEQVKRMFFREDEVAMQLHLPPADHISHHPHCLHLWRPLNVSIPLPHDWMVGPRLGESEEAVRERAEADLRKEGQ